MSEELSKLLSIYRKTQNVNARSGISQHVQELHDKFVRYSYKLRPTEKEMSERKNINGKHYEPAKKYILRIINSEKPGGNKEPL